MRGGIHMAPLIIFSLKATILPEVLAGKIQRLICSKIRR